MANSKEATIINNNLVSMKRVFGTEISNLQSNQPGKEKKNMVCSLFENSS